jgi:hypothetical protein
MFVPKILTVRTEIQGWFKAVAILMAGMEPKGEGGICISDFCELYFVYLLYLCVHCQFRTTRRKAAQIYISIRPRNILNRPC